MVHISNLSLSHGQVAWALARGEPPTDRLLDQLRYLRQLGVPFAKDELGRGRGNQIRYGYYHLAELGVSLFSVRRGMKPREVTDILVPHRKALRRIYRQALIEQPEAAIEASWIKRKGREIPILENEMFLRLHDRFSDKPGTFETVPMDELDLGLMAFDMVERYPGESARTLVPLTRIALELVAWAREAPETRPGRK